MAFNFTQALESARRKSQLRGVPVSQQEVSGIATAASESASDRLAQQRALDLQKESQETQKAQFAQKMEQNKEDREAAAKASKVSTTASAGTTGAVLGYGVAGSYVGGVYGAIIGAGIGLLASECIIISVCTSKDSYEVEIARQFRDKYMGPYHLGGYYALAHRIAPLIDKSHFLKLIFKKFLVDRLADYGEWVLGMKPERQLKTSRIVTGGFLALCATVGMHINVQPYIEAHRS